jgi:hypothetical protein
MLSMIDSAKDYEAHLTLWAPFVLVGEGAAADRSLCVIAGMLRCDRLAKSEPTRGHDTHES